MELQLPIFVRFTGAQVIELPLFKHDVFLRQLSSWSSTAFVSLTNASNATILATAGINPNVLAGAYIQQPVLGINVRIPAGSQSWITSDIAGSCYLVLSWEDS